MEELKPVGCGLPRLNERPCDLGTDGERETVCLSRAEVDEPHHGAVVRDQRATAVARVYRRIGLDEGSSPKPIDGNGPVHAADRTPRDRQRQCEWESDRGDVVAQLRGAGRFRVAPAQSPDGLDRRRAARVQQLRLGS